MRSSIKTKIIGIRPGEKIHELLCSADESQNVRKMKNHLVILPSYTQNVLNKRYINNLGEKGSTVKKILNTILEQIKIFWKYLIL